jgi:hypothetical protein
MTDEQINVAIAEACGWTNVNATHRSGKAPDADYVGSEFIPNYCGDLNAMHEAEKVLTFKQIAVYCDLLTPPEYGVWWKIHTTARQRAEAFLRTLGKWEEGE